MLLKFTLHYAVFHGTTVHRVTWGYTRLHKITQGYKRLHRVTSLTWGTHGYIRLQGYIRVLTALFRGKKGHMQVHRAI